MPTDVRLIRPREFLKATVDGTFDTEESRKLLLGRASAVPSPEDVEVLVDVRDAPLQLRLPDLYELAREFTELRIAANRRTALLVSPERYDEAEFFAVSAGGMGRRVHGFTSFEDAFDWLVAEAAGS